MYYSLRWLSLTVASVVKSTARRIMQVSRSGWARIIEAVDKPLGFYVLALLIVEGFLSLILIFSDLSPEAQEDGMWAVVGLFVFVVFVVSMCVWFKPKNLIFGELGTLADMGKATYGTEANVMTPKTPDDLPSGVPKSEEGA